MAIKLIAGVFGFLLVCMAAFGLSAVRAENSNFVPLREELAFLEELKSGSKIKNDVVLSIGPYHAFRTFFLGDNYIEADNINIDLTNSAYLFLSGGTFYMMFDYEFYKRLSAEERKFVIAHEFWHFRRAEEAGTREGRLTYDEAVQETVRADTFASAHVDPRVIIQFLNVHCNNKKERDIRIESISKFIKK